MRIVSFQSNTARMCLYLWQMLKQFRFRQNKGLTLYNAVL